MKYSPLCYCYSPVCQVKAATGEEVSAEELGGADLHCKYVPVLGFLDIPAI